MAYGRVDVRPLGREHAAAATAVLCDAFASYPVMTYVLGDDRPARERLETLIGFFVAVRLLRDEPILGAVADGALRGVALVSYPEVASPPALDALRERTWATLGDDARARYTAYGAATQRLSVAAPHVHLNMLAVPPALQGRGVGRALLDAVHALARARAGSAGVTLTTEVRGNVALYEHVGYRVIGHAPVAPGLESWGLYRPEPAPDRGGA